MYRYLDRSVVEIDAGAALLVRAMRDWVAAVRAGRCPRGVTARRFAVAGVDAAVDAFGAAMAMFSDAGSVGIAHGTLRFRSPGTARVGYDEARLLTLFDGPVEGGETRLRRLAATLVDEAAVPRLMRAVGLVAARIAASHVSTRFD